MDVFINCWILISIFGILVFLRLLILMLLKTHSHFAAGFPYVKVITRPTWYVVDGPTFVSVFGGVFWFHEEWSDGVDGFVVHVNPMLFENALKFFRESLYIRDTNWWRPRSWLVRWLLFLLAVAVASCWLGTRSAQSLFTSSFFLISLTPVDGSRFYFWIGWAAQRMQKIWKTLGESIYSKVNHVITDQATAWNLL